MQEEVKELRIKLSAALEKAAAWEANSQEKQRSLEMMSAHNKVIACITRPPHMHLLCTYVFHLLCMLSQTLVH